MTTREKWIIGIAVLLLVLAGVYIAFGQSKPKFIPIPPESWPAGCDPKNPGYDMQGNLSDVCVKIYCAINPDDVSVCNAVSDCYNGCLSSRPGYGCDGKRSPNC